jgi:uncharacterized membrane protein
VGYCHPRAVASNPLTSIAGAIITGVILALIIIARLEVGSTRALAWFRWRAIATWLTGFWYLTYAHQFISALTLGHGGQDRYGLVIGRGMWIGSIMLFNVWVLIWPN